MKRRATCFFCYCWDNPNAYELLALLKKKIEEESNNEIAVILDKKNYRYNEDFDEKLKKIAKYDLIVPFFSPEFKSIISEPDRNEERELVKEYLRIKERFDEEPNSVFPIILSGTKTVSLPECFSRKNCPNINKWKVKRIKETKEKILFVPKQEEAEYDKIITDLIGQIKYNFYKKSVEYNNARQAIDKLFWLTNTTELPNSCLVKVDIYPKIINQEYYFIAGRKGSGKSTFINNLKCVDQEYFENNYKRMMPINAEDFNHDFLYGELIRKNIADRNIMPPKDILVIFWQLYFILQSILMVAIEGEDGRILESERRKVFKKMSNKLKDMLSLKYPSGRYKSLRGDNVPKQLFMLAATSIDEQYGIAIGRSNEKNIQSTFLGYMNVVSILETMFGEELLNQFLCALEECTKKIIISLDGFDTNSEDFRKETQKLSRETEEYRNREEYERYFFRTLIEVVTKFKNDTFCDPILSTFQEYLDFCIVLPKDRFDQIIADDRDSAKKKFCSLVWDAYDLLELIVRRLEYLIIMLEPTVQFKQNEDIFERFQTALEFFPTVPKVVTINVDGYNRQIDLYNYLLRFSIWRPRDVISNFSSILAYAVSDGSGEKMSIIKNGTLLDNEMLKLTIKSNSKKIIQKELLDEYKNVFRNLESVLTHFMDSNLIVEANAFCNQLSKIHFDASYAYDLDGVSDKLYVLYELGIIGLYFDKNTAHNLGYLHHICFVFNAGLDPIKSCTKSENYETFKAKIIFNPIFVEKLSLKINTSELIGNWEKEYIIRLHSMKSIIHTI
mgnify:CR=1 FL=1